MKSSQITEESIAKLMEVFYKKIRVDKQGLGEIFNAKVGTDNESWKAHKAKIANFWCGMMLNTGDYSGNPLQAHIDLDPFPRELFSKWLELFYESLSVVYETAPADEFYSRAQMIANRFQAVLYGG